MDFSGRNDGRALEDILLVPPPPSIPELELNNGDSDSDGDKFQLITPVVRDFPIDWTILLENIVCILSLFFINFVCVQNEDVSSWNILFIYFVKLNEIFNICFLLTFLRTKIVFIQCIYKKYTYIYY
jgi:hypothetical protein